MGMQPDRTLDQRAQVAVGTCDTRAQLQGWQLVLVLAVAVALVLALLLVGGRAGGCLPARRCHHEWNCGLGTPPGSACKCAQKCWSTSHSGKAVDMVPIYSLKWRARAGRIAEQLHLMLSVPIMISERTRISTWKSATKEYT